MEITYNYIHSPYINLLLQYLYIIESSTPATTAACPELLSPSTSQSHCTPWSNCTGLNCHNPLYGNKNVSIVIDKCTDPLVYHLTVYNTDSGDVLNHSVIRTAQSNDNRNYFGLYIQLGRNASHAKFEVINIHF